MEGCKDTSVRRSQRVEASGSKKPVSTSSVLDSSAIKEEIKLEIIVKVEITDSVEEGISDDIQSSTDVANVDFDVAKAVKEIIDKVVKGVSKERNVKFNCAICDYQARDNYNLKRHKEVQHGAIQLKCLVCDKEFASRFDFDTHFNDCFLECPVASCSKRFKTKRRLDAHKRMHTKLLSRY